MLDCLFRILSDLTVIKYCNQCGKPVVIAVPAGDSLPRHVCTACQHIQYENPRLILGCVVEFNQQILLCRRAIEPRYGYWTLPAGFMENGETSRQGSMRETLEEAGASVLIDAPFAIVSIAHINQVHFFYRGHLLTPEFSAGEESLVVALFSEENIPWDDLAFTSVKYCLECYFEDRARQKFGFHETSLLAG
jgi:ADP-ribose pyrophosphatase YjhB (NUDIX family)